MSLDLDSIKSALSGDSAPAEEVAPEAAPEVHEQPVVEDGSKCRVCGRSEVESGVCQYCGIVQHIN